MTPTAGACAGPGAQEAVRFFAAVFLAGCFLAAVVFPEAVFFAALFAAVFLPAGAAFLRARGLPGVISCTVASSPRVCLASFTEALRAAIRSMTLPGSSSSAPAAAGRALPSDLAASSSSSASR